MNLVCKAPSSGQDTKKIKKGEICLDWYVTLAKNQDFLTTTTTTTKKKNKQIQEKHLDLEGYRYLIYSFDINRGVPRCLLVV